MEEVNDKLTWKHVRRGAVRMWIDSFTTADGRTWDVGRILGFWVIAGMCVLESWSVIIQGQHFDAQGFGVGIGTAMGGMGALLAFKAGTEPKP